MDDRLKMALDKAKAMKEEVEARKQAALKVANDEHKAWLARYMPAARKWINEKLYDLIAHEEATCPYSDKKVWLGSGHKDGVPVEAIYEAAKEVEGLIPSYHRGAIYQDAEYQNYTIRWKSETNK